jgi:hypothetical protein
MQRSIWAGLALALSLGASAHANDSSAALGAGGLVLTKTHDIAMRSEDLAISPKRVTVRYVFVNESSSDIDEIVAFPMPDIDAGEFWEEPLGTTTADPVNFMGFAVHADGKLVPVSVEQRAMFKGADVTARVKAAGLPVNVVGQDGVKRVDALSPAKRAALKNAGLLDTEDTYSRPLWTVTTKFYWRQHFPAGKPITVEHSYQPVTGQSFFSHYELEAKGKDDAYVTPYCMDAGTRARVKALLAERTKSPPPGTDAGYLSAYSTEYVLMTANNWKGPIGHFHLTVDKLAPANVLSLCWDGDLKKTGATRFEAVRENFAPARDLKMLVLQ